MRKTYSKYILLFSMLTASAFIICWGANVLLLSRYYVSKMELKIEQVYEHLNSITKDAGVTSDEFMEAFVSDTELFNCDILLLDQNMEILACNAADTESMSVHLLDIFFKKEALGNRHRMIRATSNYILVGTPDGDGKSEYIELCGTLNTGNPILIRSSVSGLNENARMANVFSAYVGIAAILISFVLVYFISKNLTLSTELAKRREMDEMRKEFISNVSHELKTPIALIQGYAEGLSDCVNDDDESREFYCDVIIDEAQKMNGLVKNLLDLNELEFGQPAVTMEVFSITELIRNALQSSDIMFKQNNIDVVFDDTNDIYVYSDELSIERVFGNYISNAIHYACGENKHITVNIDVKERSRKVRVSVFNTGENIPDDAIANIWNKFYKVDKARTREYGGSGVGLSIVKATMESLNEKYGVLNKEDGVEFWFEAQYNKI